MDKCADAPFLQSEVLFRVLDTLADMVLCLDKNFKLVYINSAAADFFSIAPEQAINYDIFALLPEAYRAVHERFLHRCQDEAPMQLKGRVFRLKLEVQPKSGQNGHRLANDGPGRLRVPVSLSISPEETELGQLFVLLVRRRMSVLAAAENILDQDDEVKTTLAAVAHEVRNPLVAIGGFARRIAKDNGLSQKSYHKLTIIQDEVARLERLVNGLNDLSKSTAYHFELTNVGQLLEHVGEIMGQQARQEHKILKLEIMPDPPRLLIDRDRMSQVLINLVRNALQACPSGGLVKLKADPADKPEFLHLAVIDNGQGIARENLAKMFQPFFTTKKGGTGLGMAVSKRIVEDHGGNMHIESVFGQGTTISILLPL